MLSLTVPDTMQYEEGSAPALALDATIAKTNARFANYAKAGLLCGTDGLPHLIADPGLALRYGHAGEIFVRSSALDVVRWIHSLVCVLNPEMMAVMLLPFAGYIALELAYASALAPDPRCDVCRSPQLASCTLLATLVALAETT